MLTRFQRSLYALIAALILIPGTASAQNFLSDVTIDNANPDIELNDTSGAAADWEISVDQACGDSINQSQGPAESFAICWDEDGAAPRGRPFTIERGAGDDAFYLTDGNDVGLGTNTPGEELHIFAPSFVAPGPIFLSGNAALRLESQKSFIIIGEDPTQIWDINGGTGIFSIENASTGGGTHMAIQTDGDVGFGTTSPTQALHVRRTDGTAQVLVDESSAVVTNRQLFRLENNGAPQFALQNKNSGTTWDFNALGANFNITRQGTGVQEFSLNGNNGNLTIQGIYIPSSRASKQDFEALDVAEVLDKVVQLPIQEWSYKRDPKVRHIGPVAEDFAQAFGLSDTDAHISSVDADGVALAAIQGLNAKLEQKNTEINALKARLEIIERFLAERTSDETITVTGANKL